jgi:hypothetical protein
MYIPSMSGFSWRIALLLTISSMTALAQEPASAPDAANPPQAESVTAPPSQTSDSTNLSSPQAVPVATPAAASDSTAPRDSSASPAAAAPLADTTPKLQVVVPAPAPLAAFDTAALGRTRHLKSDPQASSLYRSPRKAFFYSLLLPGAGQAYVGHWGRGAVFLATDLALGFGWWYYAIHKSDEEMDNAHDYANKNWSSKKYESAYQSTYKTLSSGTYDTNIFSTVNSSRSTLCASIYGASSPLYNYCNDGPVSANANYGAHFDTMSKDITPANRSFRNSDEFYSLIGDQNEFVTGWSDAAAPNVLDLQSYYSALADGNADTKPATLYPFGTSNMQNIYNSMRNKSNDYARMQKWFLGGMLLNHLAAALDAALLAQSSNRRLYEMESRWWENVHVWGGLAWNGAPATQVQTWIEF